MQRTIRLAPAVLALTVLALLLPPPARAANKEMIELQTQVRALQDAIARLQQSNDERMGVMKDLVVQTTDSVNKMQLSLDTLQRQVRAQSDGTGAKVEQVSGQMQSLNDSLDEMKERFARMEKSLADMNSAQQTMNARLASTAAPAAPGVVPDSPTPMSAPPMSAAPAPVTRSKPSAAAPAPPTTMSAAPVADALPTPSAPPVEDLYRTAFGDYNGAKYTLATAEFNDLIHYYPDSTLAGNAYFYLGEINFKAGRFAPATKSYDRVIEQFPGNNKVAVSQLRKGESLIALKQNDAAARELRSLIQRFPNSPEAITARSKLNAIARAR